MRAGAPALDLEDVLTQSHRDAPTPPLLVAGVDPDPVVIVNPDATSGLLLVCEHAGHAIPAALGDLGLPAAEMQRHIAYDIGAQKVARHLARAFNCKLILQRYSRLVIDCNRPPGTAQSIPEVSDGTIVPANAELCPTAAEARAAAIFAPYAAACRARIADPRIRFAYSVHSFTPRMDGVDRPWDIGFLHRTKASHGEALTARASRLWPEMKVGDNQPYQIETDTDWFVPACAEPRGIPHALIELRNDHLLTDAGCADWAIRLHRLLSEFMEVFDDSDP